MCRVMVFAVLLAVAGLAVPTVAQTPSTISYQGRLVNAGGVPISTATTVQFSLYPEASGGSAVWAESLSITPDSQGLFSAELGLTTPLTSSLFEGSKKYLGIRVGSDAEMTPRQLVTAVPYALRAASAPVVDNSIATATIQDNAVTAAKIAPNVVSSVAGVSNDGGDIALVGGPGMTVTPDNDANSVTIAPSLGIYPIAWAVVDNDGSIRESSGNIWSTYVADSVQYELTVAGVDFSYDRYLVTVQPAWHADSMPVINMTGTPGRLIVTLWNNAGLKYKSNFQVIIYALPAQGATRVIAPKQGKTQAVETNLAH